VTVFSSLFARVQFQNKMFDKLAIVILCVTLVQSLESEGDGKKLAAGSPISVSRLVGSTLLHIPNLY
jgi:hypothetical protein